MSVALIKLAPHADQKEAAEALERRQRADYQCYLAMRQYWPEIRSALALSVRNGLDRGDYEAIVSELENAIREREEANEAFLSSMIDCNSVVEL